jgi:hypothetical protein
VQFNTYTLVGDIGFIGVGEFEGDNGKGEMPQFRVKNLQAIFPIDNSAVVREFKFHDLSSRATISRMTRSDAG